MPPVRIQPESGPNRTHTEKTSFPYTPVERGESLGQTRPAQAVDDPGHAGMWPQLAGRAPDGIERESGFPRFRFGKHGAGFIDPAQMCEGGGRMNEYHIRSIRLLNGLLE